MTRQLQSPPPGTPVVLVVQGEPMGKARPRVTRRGTFMPKAYVKYLDKIATLTRVAMAGRPPISRPCKLHVVSMKSRPASRPASCPKEAWVENHVPCSVKPDADNILGSVMDGLEKGGAYTMDSRVCQASISTYWCAKGDSPRVEIYLESL